MTPLNQPPVIAIDGPSGSGKSTVSARIAKKFGYVFLSTGAFYRGLAYLAFKKEVDLNDESAVVALIDSPDWQITANTLETRVKVLGVDVTDELNNEQVGALASRVSRSPTVRLALLEPQRRFRKFPGLVAEGRDCGTVVFPDALVKIFLTADLDARAVRRFKEDTTGASAEAIKEAQKKRDQADATRKAAPMAKAEDAIELDTSNLTLDEVVDKIEQIIQRRLAK
jgi:cytidylate kinase